MSYEIDFKSPCPVYKCFIAGRKKEEIYWIDSNCRHHYKLTRFGKLKCIGYNCYNNSESDLLGAKFKCEYHERESGSYQAFLNAVQIACQINLGDNQKDADDFCEDLIEALRVQRKKYRNIN
jgi:hypothetical protein